MSSSCLIYTNTNASTPTIIKVPLTDWISCSKSSTSPQKDQHNKSTSYTVQHKASSYKATCKQNGKTVDYSYIDKNTLTDTFKYTPTSQRTFAEILQESLSSTSRDKINIVNSAVNCSMNLNAKNTALKHNVGGNINLTFNIPVTAGQLPNYVEMILSKSDQLANYTILKTLMSLFTSTDMIAYYHYNQKATTTNSCPAWNMSSKLSSPRSMYGWNVNRNYDAASAKAALNYHAEKINELIHYIIANNVAQANPEVRSYWYKLFGSSRDADAKVYNHAINTLLLPSLVNYFADNKTRSGPDTTDTTKYDDYVTDYSQAISYGGYVPAGCPFFPINDGEELSKLAYFNSKTNVKTNPLVNAAYSLNGTMKGSAKNHPFIPSNRKTDRAVATPTTKIDYMKNIPLKFSSEKYKWTDSTKSVTDWTDFATRYVGEVKKATIKNWVTTSTLKDTIGNVKLSELAYLYDEYPYPTSSARINNFTLSSRCWYLCVPIVYTSDPYYEYGVDSKLFKRYRMYGPDTDYTKKFCATRLASMQPGKYRNPTYNIKKVAYSKSIGDVQVLSEKTLDEKWVKGAEETVEYRKACNCGAESRTRRYTYVAGKIRDYLKNQHYSENDTVNITVEYDVKHWADVEVTEYWGSYAKERASCRVKGKNNKDTDPEKDPRTICYYTTNAEWLHFSNYSYLSWFFIATSLSSTDKVVKEIRKFVTNNPDILLASKCYDKFADEVRSKGESGDYYYFNIPLLSMVVKIPDSWVLPYKYYMPGINVINPSTVWKNIQSSTNGVNVNTFMVMEHEHKNVNNYLDVVMKCCVDSAYQKSTWDNADVFCVLLPTRGKQLFDVIDKSIVRLLPSLSAVIRCKVNDKNSVFYKTELTKLVFSTFDFNSNSTTKALLGSTYKALTVVNAPRFTVTKDSTTNNYVCSVVAKNGDTGSRVWIYISYDKTQEIVASNTDKTVGNVVNRYITINYNGIDANITPTCLQKHFE